MDETNLPPDPHSNCILKDIHFHPHPTPPHPMLNSLTQ